MENKKRYILIAIIMMILVISVSTYAWLSYRSKETAMVLTIGEVGSINIRLQPYKFSSSIDPTITYEGNDYVNVTASNQSDKVYNIKLYYKINDIPEELIDENFKYTILRSNDGENYSEYDEGNFSNAESGSEYVILDKEKLKTDTEYSYKVYLWIEGGVSDNTDMQGKVFDAELRADYEETTSATVLTYNELSNNYSCANNSIGDNPIFTYTGDCEVVDDGDENWKVKFLTSGTFESLEDTYIDAFLVGGGGGGGNDSTQGGGGGGAGGYTNTSFVNIKSGVEYEIIIGAGGTSQAVGNDTTAFNTIAYGGGAGSTSYVAGKGGTGGSGGGRYSSGIGASDGGSSGGVGQGTTTREFGEETGQLYAGGGGGGGTKSGTGGRGGSGGGGAGGNGYKHGGDGTANTGGGGGGSGFGGGGYKGGSGGSGVVIIRNHRDNEFMENLPSVGFDFIYTGKYLITDDGNGDWRIKFLTSGTFTSSVDLQIDAFLVGGGGGGGNDSTQGGGGGGAGGYTNTSFVNIKSGVEYEIIIGAGGTSQAVGNDTTAFNAIAYGGGAGSTSYVAGKGGTGGSGGGRYSSGIGASDGGSSGGVGQGTTTREFGEKEGQLYAGGGGGGGTKSGTGGSGGSGGGGHGGNGYEHGIDGVANTGGGGGGTGHGGGGYKGGSGGSGIVIIRNHRDDEFMENLPSVGFDFTYTGNYLIADDGNGDWRIKFLTSGTFTSSVDLQIDAFLVGGGGGGGNDNAGSGGGSGGGGGYTNTSFVNVKSSVEYEIIIGEGGTPQVAGNDTTAFNLTASGGGNGTIASTAGSGGSGGGKYSSGIGASDGGSSGGVGQGTTTREFGEETGQLYAGGGGGGGTKSGTGGSGGAGGGGHGGNGYEHGIDGVANTGGGGGGTGHGGGGYKGGTGGSGIVIIRNKR